MIKLESIPFVSIVIPTTGNVKFIKGLVESVSKLDYPKDKFELILIDLDSIIPKNSDFFYDGAHLNNLGSEHVSDKIKDELIKLFEK